jgi:hypothetical protein
MDINFIYVLFIILGYIVSVESFRIYPKIDSKNVKILKSRQNNNMIDILKGQSISYATGGVGLTILLLNRLSILIDEVSDVQSRVDVSKIFNLTSSVYF